MWTAGDIPWGRSQTTALGGPCAVPGGSAVGPSHHSPRVCGFQAHEAPEAFHSRNPLPFPLISETASTPDPPALSPVRHPSFEMSNNTCDESTLPPGFSAHSGGLLIPLHCPFLHTPPRFLGSAFGACDLAECGCRTGGRG